MERWAHKVIAMLGLFVIMGFFALIPLKVSDRVLRSGAKGALIISALSCFGGGVFFGTYLLHVGPETAEAINHLYTEPNDISYPVAEIVMASGFFFILFLEKTVLIVRNHLDNKTGPAVTEDNVSGHGVIGRFNEVEQDENGIKPDPVVNSLHVGIRDFGETGSVGRPASGGPTVVENGMALNAAALSDLPNGMKSKIEAEEQYDREQVEIKRKAGMTRSIVFMIALSLDCIFEGMSLGLQYTTVGVWNMFVAIIGHEFIVSFCMGMELVKYYNTKQVIIAALFYAFTPAIGGIIGTIIVEGGLSNDPESTDLLSAFLQCLCAGTFIYCAFIGILAEELTHGVQMIKSFAVLAGVTVMALLALIPDPPEEIINANATAIFSNALYAQ